MRTRRSASASLIAPADAGLTPSSASLSRMTRRGSAWSRTFDEWVAMRVCSAVSRSCEDKALCAWGCKDSSGSSARRRNPEASWSRARSTKAKSASCASPLDWRPTGRGLGALPSLSNSSSCLRRSSSVRAAAVNSNEHPWSCNCNWSSSSLAACRSWSRGSALASPVATFLSSSVAFARSSATLSVDNRPARTLEPPTIWSERAGSR